MHENVKFLMMQTPIMHMMVCSYSYCLCSDAFIIAASYFRVSHGDRHLSMFGGGGAAAGRNMPLLAYDTEKSSLALQPSWLGWSWLSISLSSERG